MDRKGLVLILVLGILAVLIIAASAFVSLTNSEMQMVKNQGNSIRAFYLAEAGVEEAVYRLKNGNTIIPDGGTITFTGYLYQAGNDDYTVTIERGGSTHTVTSTGAYPNLTASDKVTRTVKIDVNVTVNVTPSGNPANADKALIVSGTIDTTGNPDIQTYQEDAGVNDQFFQNLFGMTKDELKAKANVLTYTTDTALPSVSGITWVELHETGAKVHTTGGWTGSGILVVDGNENTGEVLEMGGGGDVASNFQGVIWVISGSIYLHGSITTSGAIFVENGPAVVSVDVQGGQGMHVLYNATAIQSAFQFLGSSVTSVTISNWQEVYP